jgi:hypothetical protein
MMKPLERSDYGEIYWRTFGKSVGREDCRKGWERWQTIWRSGADQLIVHPNGDTPVAHDDDQFIVARHGPLRFVARASREYFPTLPGMWISAAERLPSLNVTRSAARTFVHNSLVDGLIMHPTFGPLMAAAIAWLMTSSEIGKLVSDYRLIGYDISFIPGPPDQKRMLNFRAIIRRDANVDAAFDATGALPLPGWQPPPH